MLVLAHQRDQSVVIGDNIEVTIVDVRGDKVRLGINAPKNVSVHRKEVYDAIRRENQAAAGLKPGDVDTVVAPVTSNRTISSSTPLNSRGLTSSCWLRSKRRKRGF